MPTSGNPVALWLVRHGESAGNVADRRAQETGAGVIELDHRDMDVPLSDTGFRQAHALGEWFGAMTGDRPTALLSSPYLRAASTAEALLAASGLDLAVRYDERLRERELGELDGLTSLGIRERFPQEVRRRQHVGKFYYRPPAGESWCDVALRVRSLLNTVRQDHDGERVLLVSHQAVIMVFRYVLEGLTEGQLLDIDARVQVANCGLTRYARDGQGRLALQAFNETRPVAERGEQVTEEPGVGSANP